MALDSRLRGNDGLYSLKHVANQVCVCPTPVASRNALQLRPWLVAGRAAQTSDQILLIVHCRYAY